MDWSSCFLCLGIFRKNKFLDEQRKAGLASPAFPSQVQSAYKAATENHLHCGGVGDSGTLTCTLNSVSCYLNPISLLIAGWAGAKILSSGVEFRWAQVVPASFSQHLVQTFSPVISSLGWSWAVRGHMKATSLLFLSPTPTWAVCRRKGVPEDSIAAGCYRTQPATLDLNVNAQPAVSSTWVWAWWSLPSKA